MEKLKIKFKNKFKNLKKGMNTIETTIIVMILLLCILTMLDMMEVNQKTSATTSAINYMTRLVGRQGGISNVVPDNFSNYGKGAYITTNSAISILNDSLRKAFSIHDNSSVIGNDVKMYFKICYLNADGTVVPNPTVIPLNSNTEFGVYIKNSHITGNVLVNQQELLYHRVYYIIYAEMEYDMFTIERLASPTLEAFVQDDGFKKYKKTFSRYIIPTYYNREYEGTDFEDNVDNVEDWFVH